jgi:uncharacterized protein YjiS (DUF1127 family)
LVAIAEILDEAAALYARGVSNASVFAETFRTGSYHTNSMLGRCRTALVGGVLRSLTNARVWSRRSNTRRHLRELDAHRLADIGLTGPERRRECAKWFWQPGARFNDSKSSCPDGAYAAPAAGAAANLLSIKSAPAP